MSAQYNKRTPIYDGGERVHAYDRDDKMQTTLISEAICDSFGHLGPVYRSRIYEIVRKSESLEDVKTLLEEELDTSTRFLREEDIAELKQCLYNSIDTTTEKLEVRL